MRIKVDKKKVEKFKKELKKLSSNFKDTQRQIILKEIIVAYEDAVLYYRAKGLSDEEIDQKKICLANEPPKFEGYKMRRSLKDYFLRYMARFSHWMYMKHYVNNTTKQGIIYYLNKKYYWNMGRDSMVHNCVIGSIFDLSDKAFTEEIDAKARF